MQPAPLSVMSKANGLDLLFVALCFLWPFFFFFFFRRVGSGGAGGGG